MAFDTKQYLEELFKDAGVSDDNVKQAVSGFFSNDAVTKRLSADVLRQSDYSRNMDALKSKEQQVSAYYQSLLDTTNKNQAVLDQALAEKARYEEEFGPLNGDPTKQRTLVSSPTDLVALEKKWNDQLAQRDSQFIELLKQVPNLAVAHYDKFKEVLDTDALGKLAMEKGLSLRQAYDEYSAPKREALSKATYDADIARARDEGAKDFASKHRIPVDTQPREHSPLFARLGQTEDKLPPAGPARDNALRSSFVEAFNGAAAGTSGGGNP